MFATTIGKVAVHSINTLPTSNLLLSLCNLLFIGIISLLTKTTWKVMSKKGKKLSRKSKCSIEILFVVI